MIYWYVIFLLITCNFVLAIKLHLVHQKLKNYEFTMFMKKIDDDLESHTIDDYDNTERILQ